MHRLRARVRGLTPRQRSSFVRQLGDAAANDWVFRARDAQLPPRDLDWAWLLLGGRGAGKTRSMSGAVHAAIRAGIGHIHLIAPTAADCHEVSLEGPSGILATCGRDPVPRYVSSRRRLEWDNGARLIFFSGEEPESLRGPNCELCLIDEIARMRFQAEVFSMATFGLRLGDRPRMIIAATPRPTPFMKRLVAMDRVCITKEPTYANARNLAPGFLKQITALYANTRLGRQELSGEMLVDVEDALFKDEWLIHDDVAEDLIEQVTVGVDPSGGGDAIGIVVCALLNDGRYAVIADRTLEGCSPGQWGDAVVKAVDDFDADDVSIEINFGGVMAAEVVRQSAERLYHLGKRESGLIRVKEVHASRGKVMRAEPISLLYEKGRVLHRRGLDQLEAELLSFSRSWDRAIDGSPNRLDAAVWALTRLSKVVVNIPIA